MGLKKIVIVSTGQPSTNPRAVKEATALAAAGYDVSFVYNFWTEWGLPFDEKIKKEHPGIQWKMAGAIPVKNKVTFKYRRLQHKYFRWLNELFPKNISFANHSSIRGFSALSNSALAIKADLYIAHNLGALPVAAMAAKKYNAKFAFDAEDYHRGQAPQGSAEYIRTLLLENEYLPGACYITAASPLIAKEYHIHYQKQVTVINNVFSLKYLAKAVKPPTKPIKLFWFSQTIGKGRGLEDIILALKEMPEGAFHVTLLGQHDEAIQNYFFELGKSENSQVAIEFLQPLIANDIFELAAQQDIGLALEQPGEVNRDLCLTNKIYTYLLAGNAIIFSETKAQSHFYNDNKEVGFIYTNGNQLSNILTDVLNNPEKITHKKKAAHQLAKNIFNWEYEANILLKLVAGIQ